MTDGSQEWLKMIVKIILSDSEIPVEQAKQLLLHQVDFGQAEAEAVKPTNSSVSSPMLVLWRRVVEVLSGEDERCKENAVGCALHALRNWWQPLL